MRVPHAYEADSLIKSDAFTDVEVKPGKWVSARCEPSNDLYPITWRIRMAWAVFTGKADALFWEDQ